MKKISVRDVNHLLHGRIPGQLVVQYADHCNATCPQCGMRVTNQFKRSRLKNDDVKKVIDHAAQNNFKAISFTGGEPLLFFDDIAELMLYAGQAGIDYIRTGTNGFIFMNSDHPGFETKMHRFAEKLADTPVRNFWISIDSAEPEVHESMRGLPGVIAGIEKALPIFHSYGIYPSANLGINRNIGGKSSLAFPVRKVTKNFYLEQFYKKFTRSLESFYQRMIEMGFTMVNTCYPMSDDTGPNNTDATTAVYAATSDDFVVRFTSEEKAMIFKGLLDTIPIYRSCIRIFSPLSSLLSLNRQYAGDPAAPYPCRGGKDFFFIDAGSAGTFPCGYRGKENLGKFTDLDFPFKPTDEKCLRCDWECFRDPSEMFGPLLQAMNTPFQLIGKLFQDSALMKCWINDLKYYRACDYFNGRMPINEEKLKKFAIEAPSDVDCDVPVLAYRKSY